jgi:glyoxylase-like metal-dependent hydrolase (beta-lactamase superfamily II)
MDRIQYEHGSRPGLGETMTMADDITWLRMPLPFSLNHINLWLLRDRGGWVIVDTGVDTNKSRDVWREVFAGPMAGDPATHVIATHLHPDHVGCAEWLVHQFDVDLWMTRDEYMLCRVLISHTGREAPEEGIRFYKAAGFSEDKLATYRANFGIFGKFVKGMPEAYKRMFDGEILSFAGHDWEVIVGRGHSPEHACLYDEKRNILISGDQILPTISPNVSVWPTEPQANPLRDWFASLDKLKSRMPEDVLVLPAHGKPFRGAHARLDELARGHTDRLDLLLDICVEPLRAVDTFESLYSARIGDNNRIMATGEAIAHLHYLCDTGQMHAEPDRNGVSYYQRA